MTNIAVIDLFAGAGGLGLGGKTSGCDLRLSVEFDALACKTLEANKSDGETVLQADVRTLDGDDLRTLAKVRKRDKLIVVGGAPCQPFSKAAYWTEEGLEAAYRRNRAAGKNEVRPPAPRDARPDERRTLVEEFWRLIEDSNADGFVFENVPSIKHPRNRPVLECFKSSAEAAGYSVVEVTAHATDYGVAQLRQRVFLLGSRKNVPIAPVPTHSGDQVRRKGLKPLVTAGEALEGLDREKYFEPEEVVQGRWADHLREVPPGWNYKAHTAWAGHPKPTFVTETRFWNFLLKLAPDKPSWTIAASPGPWTGPFHWKTRRLRTVEMAALQGFPKKYSFAGSRRDRVRQIGNAVPPPLAKVMISAVAEAIE